MEGERGREREKKRERESEKVSCSANYIGRVQMIKAKKMNLFPV
jgi:hypothetical protein